MYLIELLFCDNEIWPYWYEPDKKETSYIDTLLIYTPWNEFLNDFNANSDLGILI